MFNHENFRVINRIITKKELLENDLTSYFEEMILERQLQKEHTVKSFNITKISENEFMISIMISGEYV